MQITKLLVVLCLMCVLSIVGTETYANAELKTFTKEYTYQASELDSKVTCRITAQEIVKRQLVEEVGVYVMSETEVVNLKLSKDKILTYSAGLVAIEVINETWNGETYWIKAKVTIDTSTITKSLGELLKNNDLISKIEELQNLNNKLMEDNSKLKLSILDAKDKAESQKIYNKNINDVSANNWLMKGHGFRRNKLDSEAIGAFSSAIGANPGNPEAYWGRGASYRGVKKYEEALTDIDKAIELDLNYTLAYIEKSFLYSDLGEYEKALAVLTIAKKNVSADSGKITSGGNLNSNIFVLSGNIYGSHLNRKDLAIKEYSSAISIRNDDAMAYWFRGDAYFDSKLYENAANDYEEVLRLTNINDFIYKDAYKSLGGACLGAGLGKKAVGKFDESIVWLTKSMEYGNKASINELGQLYLLKLKDVNKGLLYLTLASEIGDLRSQIQLSSTYSDIIKPPNYTKSFYWLVLAVNNQELTSFEEAKKSRFFEMINEHKVKLEVLITTEEQNAIRNKAANWTKKDMSFYVDNFNKLIESIQSE